MLLSLMLARMGGCRTATEKPEFAARHPLGQLLPKDSIRDQPFFNPHYLTACLFLQVSAEVREERMRPRQVRAKFRGLQSARGRGLTRTLQIAVRDPGRSYLACHLVT
jgi:hypothetical protein